MELLQQFPVEFDRVLNVLSSIVGILGFLFGLWRYFRERKAKDELGDRERQLKETLSRLENMRKLARDLDQHPAVMRL